MKVFCLKQHDGCVCLHDALNHYNGKTLLQGTSKKVWSDRTGKRERPRGRLVRRFVSGNFKAPFESGKKERSRNSNVFTEGKAEFHVEAFVGRRGGKAHRKTHLL